MIRIGLDPAFRKSGFCICIIDIDKSIRFITFKKPLDFIGWLFHESPEPGKAIFCVENSNLQNQTFNMAGTKQMIARRSRDVGKNMAASQYTVDLLLERYGAKYVLAVSPKQKGKKWDRLECAMVCKQEGIIIKKNTSQDERDSLKLALMINKWTNLSK